MERCVNINGTKLPIEELHLSFLVDKLRNEFGDKFGDYSSFIPSSMSFLLTVGFLKVGKYSSSW